jgi:hypothetical protein
MSMAECTWRDSGRKEDDKNTLNQFLRSYFVVIVAAFIGHRLSLKYRLVLPGPPKTHPEESDL